MEGCPPSLSYLATSSKNRSLIRQWLKRPMGPNRFVVWQDMIRLGVRQELKDLLMYETEGQRNNAFLRLFDIDEDVYREIVVEFMMTFQLNPRMSITDKKKISFRFQEQIHYLSVADLGVYLGLYSESQVDSTWFRNSVLSISSLANRNHKDIWADLAGTEFKSCVKSSTFIKPVHHILHKLLVCSIFGKKEGGAVSGEELKFMEAIIGKKNLNVAYLVAERLWIEKDLDKHMYMGSIITRLLYGMELLTEANTESYSVCSKSLPFDLEYCKMIRLIDENAQKQCIWRNTKQVIPDCYLTRKRVRESSPPADNGAGHSERAQTSVPHGGAETVEPSAQATVHYTDPVTSLTQYYILHALQASRSHQLLISRRLGIPDPEPYMYRCGPPPPAITPPYTTMPPHPPSPIIRTTPTTEQVHSVETETPAAQPVISAPMVPHPSVIQPVASGSYRPDMVYLGSDALSFDASGMMLNLGPISSSAVPTETMLRQAYMTLLEQAGVTSEILLQWGYTDPMKLPAATLRDILVQLKLINAEELGQRVSSGQQSVVGPFTAPAPTQHSDAPDQGSPAS